MTELTDHLMFDINQASECLSSFDADRVILMQSGNVAVNFKS